MGRPNACWAVFYSHYKLFMPLIKPFKGLRPSPENASELIAPPYDVISFQEACDLAKNKPNSFLHISRPEIDLPAGTNPYSSEVYARGATTLKGMIESGVLFRDDIKRDD